MGCDFVPCRLLYGGWQFQSTHPRGVRLSIKGFYSSICYFNPRTHVGCDDQILEFGVHAIVISIHAPTWGATTPVYRKYIVPLFQSTHPRGVRRHGRGCLLGRRISIHAPTWGATVKPSNGWLLGHKDNEFANENIIIINSVNIT